MDLFLPDWLQDSDLRRKVTAGLNKGEARNTLARAVFFNRLGEIWDRSFEQQRYRASCLSPLTLGWEHLNLTGHYTWPRANQIKPGKYRPLRSPARP